MSGGFPCKEKFVLAAGIINTQFCNWPVLQLHVGCEKAVCLSI